MTWTCAPQALTDLIRATFEGAGCVPEEARIVADHLVNANLVGHDSHGVIRLSSYLAWLRDGSVVANRQSRIALDRGPMLCLDGEGGFGQVVARRGMTLGTVRAREQGIALVAVRNCGHLGRVGAWAEMAATAGLVSVHFVNTSGFGILVAPHGGSDRRLSANPVAAGIPVPGRDPLILDIATSVIAEGKIQVARNRNEPLPEGSVLDGHGRPTRDAERFYADPLGAILPFGGHKGSGLSILCEALAGAVTGGRSSHPGNPDSDRLVNNMLTVLLEPGGFSSEAAYAEDVRRLVSWVAASPPSAPDGEVLLPGEPERRTRAARIAGGIPLDEVTRTQVREGARSAGVAESLMAFLGT